MTYNVTDNGKNIIFIDENDEKVFDKSDNGFEKDLCDFVTDKEFDYSSDKEQYLVECIKNRGEYFKYEKWWGILPHDSLIEVDYKKRIISVVFPTHDSELFSKDMLRTLRELIILDKMYMAFLEIEDVELLKRFLMKKTNNIIKLKRMPYYYVNILNMGLITHETFLTFNDKRIEEENKRLRMLEKAKEYDDRGIIPYEEEWTYFDEYFIRAPESYEEIVVESIYMHNCLNDYLEDIKKNEKEVSNKVFFMRKFNEYGELVPYIDIEVGDDGLVKQALKRFNGYPSCEDLEVVMSWIDESSYTVGIDEDEFNQYGRDVEDMD